MHVEVLGISIKRVAYNPPASFESCSFFSNLTLPLQAYDQHLNMILGDVEETVTTIEIDEETYEEIYKSTKRNIPMLFVRGDGVVLVAPPLRVG